MIDSFNYALHAQGHTHGKMKCASLEEATEIVLSDGTVVRVVKTIKIQVIQP